MTVREMGEIAGPDRVTAALATEFPVRLNPLRQWWVLAARGVTRVIRRGDIIAAFISPAFVAVCYYIPLQRIMNMYPGMDYSQFLMPLIVLQSLAFVASSAALRVSFDSRAGINTRFRALPMPAIVPPLARFVTNLFLLAIAVSCGLIACFIIGWRPGDGVIGVVTTLAIAAMIGTVFALNADGIGMVAGSPQATSQMIALPTLILGMLSSGVVPVERFPEWIQPFVRNQPVTQFVNSLRAADNGTLTWTIFQPTVLWCIGLVALAAVLFRLSVRKQAP